MGLGLLSRVTYEPNTDFNPFTFAKAREKQVDNFSGHDNGKG